MLNGGLWRVYSSSICKLLILERETGLEPATSSLGKSQFTEYRRLPRLWSDFPTSASIAESATSRMSLSNRGRNEVDASAALPRSTSIRTALSGTILPGT